MIAFIVIRENYWAKGESYTEAVKNFAKYTPQPLRKQDQYLLVIYDVVDHDAYEHLGINDFMEVERGKDDKKIYHRMETF